MSTDSGHKKPIVGVLITNKHVNLMLDQSPDGRLALLQEANRKAGTALYFFSARDIDPANSTVNGVYHDTKKNCWQQKPFPYPDVLYNRGGLCLAIFREELRSRGVRNINYIDGFNKWEVHQALQKNPSMAPHLPETKLCKSASDLTGMLDKHQTIFLKSCRGRKGFQVLKVSKLARGAYECRNFKEQLHVQIVRFDRLYQEVRSFFGRKKYIAQEAIALPETPDGKVVDMRAEVQRDGRGSLSIAGISVRVGQSGSPITTHGTAYSLEQYHKEIMGYPRKKTRALRKIIAKFLDQVFSAIEDIYGPTGEMGIDFALDQSGKLWLIECNSQPTKVSLMKAYDSKTVLQAYRNPLEYAKYLYAGSGRA